MKYSGVLSYQDKKDKRRKFDWDGKGKEGEMTCRIRVTRGWQGAV